MQVGVATRKVSVHSSVGLSVCLSVNHVHCDKTEENSVQIFITYERSPSPVLWEEERLVGSDPFYLKFWVNRPPIGARSLILSWYSLVAPQQ